jgi:hypothetical protein
MDKYGVNVGSLFSDGGDRILKVTWFIFSDLVQYKNGETLPVNEVHVDIYKENENGELEIIGRENFINIKNIHPLQIKESYLKAIGFKEQDLNGTTVLQMNKLYFLNLNNFNGVFVMRNSQNDNFYPVTSMHEVQQLINAI